MSRQRPVPHRTAPLLIALVLLLGAVAPATAATSATVRVLATDLGPAPGLGYNLGHFVAGSNAIDWWRYSGIARARAFVSPSDIEPTDDLAPVGDGVTTLAGFTARRALVRAAAVADGTTNSTYVDWNDFVGRYLTATGDTNEFTVDGAFSALRAEGVQLLVNLTASPSRFPIASDADWAGKWELWQHYYAQAFLLATRYGVSRFGTFNEPNNWTGMTPDDWHRRLAVAADALRAGVADASAKHGLGLAATIYAPNTANGASKFDAWGLPAVSGRTLRYDGTNDPAWRNLDVYNYQKYSMTAAGTPTAYSEDAAALRARIDASMGTDPTLPMALTEFNVRTGSDYDGVSSTLDSPSDFSQLAVNLIAVARRGLGEVYLFKFAQTARSGGTYPVAKNGTHYAENGSLSGHAYGGATKGAEVWRLLAAACGEGRRMLETSTTAGALATMACRASSGGPLDVVLANTSTTSYTVTLDVAALGIPAGASVVVSEISSRSAGGVATTTVLGRSSTAGSLSVPGQSVVRIRVAERATTTTTATATADTVLSDGVNKNSTGGTAATLLARSDGGPDARRVSLVRIAVPDAAATADRILLALQAANASRSGTYQVHVYGLTRDDWTEGTTTWKTNPSLLQGVDSGRLIANNVVAGQGTAARILGQLVTSSTSLAWKRLDVTDFVRSQAADGFATFLVVQDHRWDVALPSKDAGDLQADGIRISAREAGSSKAPRLEVIALQ